MKNIENRNIRKLYLKLLPVQIFVAVTAVLSSLVNGFFIGRFLGPIDMTALGLVAPAVKVISAVASIVSGGMLIICGNLMGKGDTKKINNVFSCSINSIIIIGFVISICLLVFRERVAIICGASQETINSTMLYIAGISIGIIPTMIIPCLMAYLQMCNKATFSLISAILLTVLNAFIDLISVGLIHNGIFGIGLATSFSAYLVMVIMIIFIVKNKNLVKYNIKTFETKTIGKIFVYGFPFALASLLYSFRNIVINNLAGDVGGVVAVNALAILGSIGVIDALNEATGSTYRMLASVFVGERDEKSLKILFKQSFIIGQLVSLIKVVIIFLASDFIVKFFGATGETVNVAKDLIHFYLLSSNLNIVVILILSTYLSYGKSFYCNIVYVISAFVAPLGWAYITCGFMGINGVWRLYYVAEIITLIFMYVVCVIRNKKIVTNLNELLWLDNKIDDKCKMSLSINKLDDVTNLSEKIEKFCLANLVDERRSKLFSLCAEEMSGNIVEHGFNKDNKKHVIDVFVCFENNELSLRLRDDCIPFDPNSRAKIVSPDDPCKNVGIRLVSKIAKVMNYQVTFGMNILTIKL